jgi:hypothetical protein
LYGGARRFDDNLDLGNVGVFFPPEFAQLIAVVLLDPIAHKSRWYGYTQTASQHLAQGKRLQPTVECRLANICSQPRPNSRPLLDQCCIGVPPLLCHLTIFSVTRLFCRQIFREGASPDIARRQHVRPTATGPCKTKSPAVQITLSQISPACEGPTNGLLPPLSRRTTDLRLGGSQDLNPQIQLHQFYLIIPQKCRFVLTSGTPYLVTDMLIVSKLCRH